MENNIIVCRCEDLTLAGIRKAIEQGCSSPDEIKRLTRCGMGPCQGNTCRDLVLKEVAAATGKNVMEIKMTTFRPPVKPIKLKSMLGVNLNDR